MTTAQALILLAIAIYLLFMLWIGWICAKKNESVDDFYLGGRKLGPFVTAMSAEASDMSSWLLMGLPGVAYLTGLAATMSTADSQLLAASSSVSQDLGNDFLKRDFSGKRGMIVARAVMVGISLIAAFLARDPDSSVFRVVSFAWAGFGAAFGPVMLMALFWKRSNKWGALAGMVVGGVMVFVWKFLIAPLGGVWAIYELLPAFLCSLVAIVVVSLLTPAPEQSVVQIFEEIRKK